METRSVVALFVFSKGNYRKKCLRRWAWIKKNSCTNSDSCLGPLNMVLPRMGVLLLGSTVSALFSAAVKASGILLPFQKTMQEEMLCWMLLLLLIKNNWKNYR